MILLPTMNLYQFNSNNSPLDWLLVDDIVMGGNSCGNFSVNEAEIGVFEGEISLENNGGFSMMQHFFPKIQVKDFRKVLIRLKGDGKTYQFRVKSTSKDYFSYIKPFTTSGHWETIEIPFEEMYPVFRGRKLHKPNYAGLSMEMIAFLFGNKKEESFRLEISSIDLE
ncbi:CIA30 family protein [Gaetbulibacter aestuarii]|uniref:CIA30 family protein n=1 Tax=Gaetbulibacter aestuarii TaxID=1502358 RepID=A0ABW7N1L3_9FLAO